MFKELKRGILHVIKTENVTAVVTCEVTNAMSVKLDIMDSLNVLVSLLSNFNSLWHLYLTIAFACRKA